jgi:hypothetical protein
MDFPNISRITAGHSSAPYCLNTWSIADARSQTNLLKRRHPNIAAVSLANKNVRTVWALLAHGREFRPDYVPMRMVA